VTGIADSSLRETLRRFDRWRTIATLLDQRPYDEPDFENSRLYFRSDYAAQVAEWSAAREKGDWGAYIIEPCPSGLFSVIRSLWHERAPRRTETIETVFTQLEDAGKYVIARVANSIRFDAGVSSLSIRWSDRDFNSMIKIMPPSDKFLQCFIEKTPGMDADNAHDYYLDQYSLSGRPSTEAVTSSDNRPYMQVLGLSFEELDAELLDGLPLATVPPLPVD